MENWFSRTELLLGKDKLEKLTRSHVLVVGLGGVGGMAAEMICRAGVGQMTIVDADVVTLTNINRQLPALHSTVGKPKAEVIAQRLLDINPALRLDVKVQYLNEGEASDLLANVDFVVDAIDTVSPKISLIQTCVKKKVRIISSMGSGAKTDPLQVTITDISKTQYCALARTVRQRLAKSGIKKGVPVVTSTEQGDKNAVLLVENEKNKKSTTGTISYMPAIFGCFMASYVIREL